MDLTVGSVVDGKVTGITKFGAFIALPDRKSGLVHISEVANTYVSDIKEHLKEGQEVKVKIINIDSEGRLNLSIKKALPASAAPVTASPSPARRAPVVTEASSFEDKLKQFMQDSDAKIAGSKQFADKKGAPRRPRQR